MLRRGVSRDLTNYGSISNRHRTLIIFTFEEIVIWDKSVQHVTICDVLTLYRKQLTAGKMCSLKNEMISLHG